MRALSSYPDFLASRIPVCACSRVLALDTVSMVAYVNKV